MRVAAAAPNVVIDFTKSTVNPSHTLKKEEIDYGNPEINPGDAG
jgi:hypothetical protein